MTANSTSFKKGQSGNPKGRPPKKRALTNLLERGGNRKFSTGADELAAKKLLVERIWQGLATGQMVFPGVDGKLIIIDLDAPEYIALAKLVLGQVDGPPKAEVDVTSAGNELKSSPSVDGMKDLFQMMGQLEKHDPAED